VNKETEHLVFCASDVVCLPYTGGTQSAVLPIARAYRKQIVISEHLVAPSMGENLTNIFPVTQISEKALIESIERCMIKGYH
jgi:hypothetical protein